MIQIDIILEGDGAYADFADKKIIHLGVGAPPIRITGLRGGMTSGRPSVSIGIQIDPEIMILAETSLRLFLDAADALREYYGDPRI